MMISQSQRQQKRLQNKLIEIKQGGWMTPFALFCNPKIANRFSLRCKKGEIFKKSFHYLECIKFCAIFAPAKRNKSNLNR